MRSSPARAGRAWRVSWLEAGAADGFARPPRPLEALRARAGLASAPARAALGWLASAPVGLSARGARGARRRRRARNWRSSGVWVWRTSAAGSGGRSSRRPLRRRIVWRRWPSVSPPPARPGSWRGPSPGRGSPPRRGARSSSTAAPSPTPAPSPRRPPRPDHSAWPPPRGRSASAVSPRPRALLQAVPAAAREGRWHALAAWWAEEAGASEQAAVELAAAADGVPGRLAARRGLVAAQAARRRADRAAQRRHLERAAACTAPPLPEVEIELAALEGASGLRALARRREPRWRGDDAARLLHVTSSAALDRGCRAGRDDRPARGAAGCQRREPASAR